MYHESLRGGLDCASFLKFIDLHYLFVKAYLVRLVFHRTHTGKQSPSILKTESSFYMDKKFKN